MTKLTFQTIIQSEYDTETNATRILKAFTTPIFDTHKNFSKKTVKKATEITEQEARYL